MNEGLRGWKTIAATIGWALCEGAKAIFPEYEPGLSLLQNAVLAPLGVWGIAHKIEKSGLRKW